MATMANFYRSETEMGYVSTGMGDSISTLLVFLMALRSFWGTETAFGLVFSENDTVNL